MEDTKRLLREFSFVLDDIRFFVNINNLREIIIDTSEQETVLKNKVNSLIEEIKVSNILDTYYFRDCIIKVELTLFDTKYILTTSKVSKLTYNFDEDYD